MTTMRLMAGCVALVLSAGCSLSPMARPTGQVPASEGASLTLRLDFGRSVQALESDVTGFKVSVKVGDTQVKALNVDEATDSLDVSGIPVGGDGVIQVEAYHGADKIGQGDAAVTLLLGRRTMTSVHVRLTQAGKTTTMPFSPLTLPAVSPGNALQARLIYSPNVGGNPERTLNGDLYGLHNNSYFQADPLGNAYWSYVPEDTYQVSYHGSSTIIGGSLYKTVGSALSAPVQVTSSQTVVPKAELDIAWNFTAAEPKPEAQLTTRELTFVWPPKPSYPDSEYAVEVYPTGGAYSPVATTSYSPATTASLTLPSSVAGGRLYYKVKYRKPGGGRVYSGESRLIPFDVPQPTRTVSTFAGQETAGSADGIGASAQFDNLVGMASDASGNLYVTDRDRIRKITPAGVVTTLAGSTKGFADGPGATAKFDQPIGLAVDPSGAVYVADMNNHRIRRIGPDGTVSTYAGSGEIADWWHAPDAADGERLSAKFYDPYQLAFDSSGGLYVTERAYPVIRRVTDVGVTTLSKFSAGFADGSWTQARFSGPAGMAVGPDGSLYLADTNNYRIRRITPSGAVMTIAGGTQGTSDGVGASAQFGLPLAIAYDPSGVLYVADGVWIRRVTLSGEVTTVAGSTQGFADGMSTLAQFDFLVGIAVTPAGLFVADQGNHRVRRVE